jgi:hypothetical protein
MLHSNDLSPLNVGKKIFDFLLLGETREKTARIPETDEKMAQNVEKGPSLAIRIVNCPIKSPKRKPCSKTILRLPSDT